MEQQVLGTQILLPSPALSATSGHLLGPEPYSFFAPGTSVLLIIAKSRECVGVIFHLRCLFCEVGQTLASSS